MAMRRSPVLPDLHPGDGEPLDVADMPAGAHHDRDHLAAGRVEGDLVGP